MAKIGSARAVLVIGDDELLSVNLTGGGEIHISSNNGSIFTGPEKARELCALILDTLAKAEEDKRIARFSQGEFLRRADGLLSRLNGEKVDQ